MLNSTQTNQTTSSKQPDSPTLLFALDMVHLNTIEMLSVLLGKLEELGFQDANQSVEPTLPAVTDRKPVSVEVMSQANTIYKQVESLARRLSQLG